MNADNSTQQASGQGWLYLTGSGDDVQQHGPFDVGAMKVLFTQNYITEHALVWTPGQDTWQPLKACQELYEQLVFSDQEPGKPPKKKKKKETTDADLLEFEAEIAAIEDGQAQDGSPPPEDRTFVDDDGTTFVWDSTLRKFCPEGMAPPGSQSQQEATGQPAAAPGQYTQDMMTFGGIDETVVTLDEAQAQQEEELLLAAQDDNDDGTVQPSGHHTSTPAEAPAAQSASDSEQGTVKQSGGSVRGSEGKSDSGAGEAKEGAAASGAQEGAAGKSNKKNNNTSVYVLGIPDDATEDEVAEEFSRCGIISQHADGSPRVKLYRDRETGMMKGDALVTFLQRPSVSLALTLMHGRALRPLRGGRPMTVQEAQFEPKGDAAAAAATVPGAPKAGNNSGVRTGTKGGAGGKGKGKKAPSHAAQALGWGGFDDKQKASEVTVVFCNLFSPDDMTRSPDLEGVLSEYIIRRCKDLGAIERVRVFRKSPGGVATARFRIPDDAQTAIQRFSGTVVVWGMFSPAEMRERGADRATEVEEDVVERAVSLDVRLVPQGGLGVLHGESGHGMVAVGCADIAGMQRLQLGFDAQSYDGRILKAEAVEAFLWDGETKPETFGQAALGALSDEARLDAYAAELQSK